MINQKTLYDLDDITIVPKEISVITSREHDVDTYYGQKTLPIFVSPMECVIGKDNFDIYEREGVIPILPRTESFEDRMTYLLNGKWVAFSLKEFNDLFCGVNYLYNNEQGVTPEYHVLIDNANGHMTSLQASIRTAKSLQETKGYKLEIMAGNVANPYTYKALAEAGADYVRCSVGSGQCCITASNTGIYYGMASLIDECRMLKNEYNLKCKIIADGGMSNFVRNVKALAIGADYTMIGTLFCSCFESSSKFKSANMAYRDKIDGITLDTLNDMRHSDITEQEKKDIIRNYSPLVKSAWGMSTKRAQISMGKARGLKKEDIKLKTSEGKEMDVEVRYTLHQWLENFHDFLASSMSYCSSRTLNDYIGNQNICLLSESAKNAKNK